MRNILITGFESYGECLDNPSAQIAEFLDGKEIGGARVAARILPVSATNVPGLVERHIADLDPVMIMGMGLWPGEPMIRIERIGINIAEFGIPDNEGVIRAGDVASNGPEAVKASWPARMIVERLLDAGIPARISDHAGTFLCNSTLYHMLRAVQERSSVSGVGFFHVPYLPAQVCEVIRTTQSDRKIEIFQRADLASMPLDLQIRAATIAIETTLSDTASMD